MRTGYDSTSATDIPTTAEVVLGYIDGIYAWSEADWARFPGAVKIGIAISATTNAGEVLDVETGDASPQQAPGWIQMRQAAGLARPTVYCNLSTIDAVRQACAGVSNWDWWSAGYFDQQAPPDQPRLDPGAVATQYSHEPYSGGHYDLSLISDGWYPQGDDLTPEEAQVLRNAYDATQFIINDPIVGLKTVQQELDALKKQIAALQPGGGPAPNYNITLTGSATKQ